MTMMMAGQMIGSVMQSITGRGTGVTLDDLDRVKLFEVMWWPTEDAKDGELLMEPLSYQSVSDINNILENFQK